MSSTLLRSALALSLIAVLGCGTKPKPAAPVATGPLDPARLLVKKTDAPVVELRLVFDAGSSDDPTGREGLTLLTVASMLEGRAANTTYAERERLLYPMAADIEGTVEREQVVFAGRVHKDHLAGFYPLLRDVLRAPAFDAVDFERVRARSLSTLTDELRGANDERLGKELLQAMVFEQHPYSHPELGTERGLKASTVDEARKQWARVLCAERLHAAISGPVDDAFIETLRADLGALRTAECSPKQPVPAAPALSARRLWVVDKPEAQSVAISMGMPIDVTRAHADYPALMLAAAYFGQHRTFAGRLMQKMRADRGLNYGDYAYAEHFVQEGGTRFPAPNVARHQQYFSMWLRPVPVDKAHFALRMAVRELDMLIKDGLSEADFARIQRFAERYFALFAQTEQERLGNALDDLFYGVTGPHLDVLRAGIRALTREQVNAALRRHVDPSKLQVAVVAPRAKELVDAVVANVPSPIKYDSEKPQAILDEDKLIEVYPVGVAREQTTVVPLARAFY